MLGCSVRDSYGDYILYSAFTVAELGEMLPEYFISFFKQKSEWVCSTPINGVGEFEDYTVYSNTEANARAKMLIWLKENNYL